MSLCDICLRCLWYIVDNRIAKLCVLLLTEEKIASRASTHEYEAAILVMARKPMVATRTSYSLNKGDHHQREKRLVNERYSLFHRRASCSDHCSDEKAELDKPLDTWTEGDVHCFVNSNFSAEIAK